MAMTVLWTGMVAASILCGLATGQMEAVSAAVTEGAAAAVTLCFSMAGVMCLWCGVMEVMKRCGLLEKLERLLRPLLVGCFPPPRGIRKPWRKLRPTYPPTCWG